VLALDAKLTGGGDAARGGGGDSGGQAAAAWELALVAVDPAWQGKGLGGGLVGRLLQGVPPGGRVTLSTQEAHVARLYERHGFAVVGSGRPVTVALSDARAPPFPSWAMARG
jgi:GNAT superfamily N-acetyltransferase